MAFPLSSPLPRTDGSPARRDGAFHLSRHGFCRALGTALASLWLGDWRRLAAWDPPAAGVLRVLSGVPDAADSGQAGAPMFRQYLNTVFGVAPGAGARVPLVLAAVTEPPVCAGLEQFSLVFHARAGSSALHGTYPVLHPSLGRFELFIAPIGAGGPRPVYEACFSRRAGAEVPAGAVGRAQERQER